MLRCCALLLSVSAIYAADYIGVTVSPSDAAGFVAITAEGAKEPMRHIPVARIIDLSWSESYLVKDKDIPIKHLALRVETLDPSSQRKVDVYRIRVSDQAPHSVMRTLSQAH
ncbi:MAG: hypothetical protein PF961_00010 [Planctomycetota bacterium]|jgi:hypothetical protein|nr:hypothetical protein [Planctomycetota bacterium]